MENKRLLICIIGGIIAGLICSAGGLLSGNISEVSCSSQLLALFMAY